MVLSLSQRHISAETIDACRRGDREAFRALYEAYKDKVYSIALYFFHGDTAAAGDAAQQVFLKLITGIAKFRGDAEFSTWLYRMVVNVCVDSVRRGKTRDRTAEEGVLEDLAGAGSQEENFARAELAGSVQAAVSNLPVKLRVAVLLRYFEDLSYSEMAQALNCSMGTVASRLSRGHQMLAEKLAPLRAPRRE